MRDLFLRAFDMASQNLQAEQTVKAAEAEQVSGKYEKAAVSAAPEQETASPEASEASKNTAPEGGV